MFSCEFCETSIRTPFHIEHLWWLLLKLSKFPDAERKSYVDFELQKQPPEMFRKKAVLRNFANSTGHHLCQRLFFNNISGLRAATLLKKSVWHRCFPVNFVKFLRTPFLQNTSGRLLLELV